MKSFSTYIDEVTITLAKKEFDPKNKDFVSSIYRAGIQGMGKGRLFGIKSKKAGSEDGEIWAKLILTPMKDHVYIDELSILGGNDFKKGFGTKMMNFIVDGADKKKIELHLTPEPLADPETGKKILKSKLISFYKRFGFKMGQQGVMIRIPK